ncbi:MAG: hypothetical protein RIQ59_480 [Bacteroidota bacterium]|jgi:hypothetical protein
MKKILIFSMVLIHLNVFIETGDNLAYEIENQNVFSKLNFMNKNFDIKEGFFNGGNAYIQ